MKYYVKKYKHYSYADYLSWNDGKQWQIIDGIPFCESPAPSRSHQTVSGNLIGILYQKLKGKKCRAFHAPFDVRFSNGEKNEFEIFNIVQPDISVYCSEKYLDDKGAFGPPDWVIEILSPSTESFDTLQKLLLYQRFGVKEYWIIDTRSKSIITNILNDGIYKEAHQYQYGEQITTKALKGLVIDTKAVFEM